MSKEKNTSSKSSNKESSINQQPHKKDSKSQKNKKSSVFKKEEKLEKELKDIKKAYAYLQAEFENFKRIQRNEREQSIKYASFPFLQDFLIHVLNDLNRAIGEEWKSSDFENFKSGIKMLHSKTIKILKQYGVQEINPQGEVFNPHFHEVVSVGQDQSQPDQTVLQVCKKGYVLHDRLVQPAQVIVNQIPKGAT